MIEVGEFERRDGYYNEELQPIDEKICGLLKPRKALSEGNPGQPLKATVTMRQYDNASVVVLSADWEEALNLHHSERTHHEFALKISGDQDYDCRMQTGSGTTGKMSYNYIISPALPDDLSGIEFLVQAYNGHGKENPGGAEFILL